MFLLILGPMASGKSMNLIADTDRYVHAGQKVLIVNSELDPRGNGAKEVSTRLGIHRPSLKVAKLSEVPREDLLGVGVVGIDELFMFSDVEDTRTAISGLLRHGVDVIASSLDVLANGRMSPVIASLFELAPDVRYVRAACTTRVSSRCERGDARFTTILRNGQPVPRNDLPDVVPDDGTYEYRPACRACFYGYGGVNLVAMRSGD